MSGQALTPEPGVTDEAVRHYRDEMDSQYRPVFDRLHRLITGMCPDADLVLSYGMPTYRIGRRRLNVGVWQHGLSLYVSPNRDGGFSARHPELASGKGHHQAQARRRRGHPRRGIPGSDTRCAGRLT